MQVRMFLQQMLRKLVLTYLPMQVAGRSDEVSEPDAAVTQRCFGLSSATRHWKVCLLYSRYVHSSVFSTGFVYMGKPHWAIFVAFFLAVL